MLSYLEYLNVPVKIAVALVIVFFAMQGIGEFLEFKGKVVPEFLKLRKRFIRKKREREETIQTLKEVRQLLDEVNSHYSEDNIVKRNDWIQWINGRAKNHDSAIVEINNNISDITQALKYSAKLIEEMFVQHSRDRIIDFAAKVVDERSPVSREEFNRIFKVYEKYEAFLENHDMTNGEVDIAYRIINESYENHMRNHTFIEDIRGYTSGE